MRPYLLVVSEISLDGKLTLSRGTSSKLLMSSMDEEGFKYLHELRAKVDAIMVGCETVRIDNPSLTVRFVKGKNPARVVPCSTGDIPLDANIFSPDAPTYIAVSKRAPIERIRALKEVCSDVLILGEEKVDIELLLRMLYQMGFKSLMVEGGALLNYELFRLGLVDELRLIHLSVVVGGEDVPSLVGGKCLEVPARFRLRSHFKRGNQLISEWEVVK
ncbi:MAG: dihydrofolate reductase family protein [Aquificaceae bacterium]